MYTFRMYEKPQYFTPDGYKRLSKNPYSDPKVAYRLELLKKLKRAELLKGAETKKSGITISDEAAAKIAMVLKEMLHSRR
jgi:hypothetical protein